MFLQKDNFVVNYVLENGFIFSEPYNREPFKEQNISLKQPQNWS